MNVGEMIPLEVIVDVHFPVAVQLVVDSFIEVFRTRLDGTDPLAYTTEKRAQIASIVRPLAGEVDEV